MAAKTCPSCGFRVNNIYKCDKCGDVRCDSAQSRGDKGACGSQKSPFGKPQPARENKKCYKCNYGIYKKI